MKKTLKLFLTLIYLTISFISTGHAKAQDFLEYQPRTGGAWYAYSEQDHKVTYETVVGYIDGQPENGYYFQNGGTVNISSNVGAPVTFSATAGYGWASFTVNLGSVSNSVTGESVWFPAGVTGRVYAEKVYKVVQYKSMKRLYNRGPWKFDRYYSRTELVSVRYYIR